MYKILVNAATMVVGGGVQVTLSYIEHAIKLQPKELNFLFIVSKTVYDNLSPDLQKDKRVVLCAIPPSGIMSGKVSRKMIKNIEDEYKPHIVYSLGFPSYIKFSNTEVGKYTNCWEINAPPLPWRIYNTKQRLQMWLMIQYRLMWAKRAKYFETQTDAAKIGIMQKLKVSDNAVKVVPNSPNPVFFNQETMPRERKENEPINIFCLAAAHRHKNLTIIPEVAQYLKNKLKADYKFILTIPIESDIWKETAQKAKDLGVEYMVQNIGPIKVKDCLQWYKNCDVVFVPTLIEIFSATYIEAMSMARPIVTTDFEFAKDICGDAALYYSPYSATDAGEAILQLLENKQLCVDLTEKGKKKLAAYPNPEVKHQMIFDWLRQLAEKQRN